MKTIGVLTSGGDAPGMNACIATIAERADGRDVRVRGIFRGFVGLLEGNYLPIAGEVSGLARRGGSFLGTSRNGDVEKALKQHGHQGLFEACGIDALIVLGGGGSLGAAASLAEAGARIIGIPCTIDNDVPCANYCIGFDSAVNRALRAVDEILDTAESLSDRVFLVETMGGQTGHIALATAYSAGADAVFINEQPIDIDGAALRIKTKMDAGATHGLAIVCEDMGTAEIAEKLQDGVGRKVRLTVLGHIQRGGNPTFMDRQIARQYGETAVEMVLSGESGKMLTYACGDIRSMPLVDTIGKSKPIDLDKYKAVNG